MLTPWEGRPAGLARRLAGASLTAAGYTVGCSLMLAGAVLVDLTRAAAGRARSTEWPT